MPEAKIRLGKALPLILALFDEKRRGKTGAQKSWRLHFWEAGPCPISAHLNFSQFGLPIVLEARLNEALGQTLSRVRCERLCVSG